MAAGSQDGAFQKDKPNAWLLIKPFLALHLLIFKDREAQEDRDTHTHTHTHTYTHTHIYIHTHTHIKL